MNPIDVEVVIPHIRMVSFYWKYEDIRNQLIDEYEAKKCHKKTTKIHSNDEKDDLIYHNLLFHGFKQIVASSLEDFRSTFDGIVCKQLGDRNWETSPWKFDQIYYWRKSRLLQEERNKCSYYEKEDYILDSLSKTLTNEDKDKIRKYVNGYLEFISIIEAYLTLNEKYCSKEAKENLRNSIRKRREILDINLLMN